MASRKRKTIGFKTEEELAEMTPSVTIGYSQQHATARQMEKYHPHLTTSYVQ